MPSTAVEVDAIRQRAAMAGDGEPTFGGLVLVSISMMMTMVGCRTNETFAVERRAPAPLSFPGVTRLETIAFEGSGGAAFTELLERRLASSFEVVRLAGATRGAVRPATHAVLSGRVTLETGRTLDSSTRLTKSDGGAPIEVVAVRRLRVGHVRVDFQVQPAEQSDRVSTQAPQPSRPFGPIAQSREAALRFERVDDPRPELLTLAPRDVPQDVLPEERELAARLLEAAAESVARDLTPRQEPARVTWRSSGLDGEARTLFAAGRPAEAAATLARRLAGSDLDAEERAELLYDLALCEDIVGEPLRAERHWDESLALANHELTQAALRDVRQRLRKEAVR